MKVLSKVVFPGVVALLLAFSGIYVEAATIVVNTVSDELGTGPTTCSLVEAISSANTDTPNSGCTSGSGADVINFSPAIFSTSQIISLTTGQVTIETNITINGPGANLLTVQNTSTAGVTAGVFRVRFNGNLTLNGLTISGGNRTGDGGGIQVLSGTVGQSAFLTTNYVVVSGNTASAYGGGIAVTGTRATATINNSTISNNTANGVAGAGTGGGGGIDNLGTVTITNSTISGNVKNAQVANSGGIYNLSTMTITNSTVTNNLAAGGASAGGIQDFSSITIRNTIVAANQSNATVPDVRGTFTSSGYNLIGNLGGVASGFVGTADQTGVSNANAGLMVLGSYGGTTPTHALLLTSFAVDKGTNFGSTTDQRGLTRTVDLASVSNAAGGNGTDIGAYERLIATAARVTVAGRILDEAGRSLGRAIVVLTDGNGRSRSTVTNSFGYFSFKDVDAGEAYVLSLNARGYLMESLVLSLLDDVSALDLTAYRASIGPVRKPPVRK